MKPGSRPSGTREPCEGGVTCAGAANGVCRTDTLRAAYLPEETDGLGPRYGM